MNRTKTLSFLAPPAADEALQRAAAAALPELLDAVPDDEFSLEDYEAEIDQAAGQVVPANSELPELFGEQFELLLIEEWPDEDWEEYTMNHRETPTASRVLYGVLKTEIAARLRSLAEAALEERAKRLGEGSPGPRGRLSPLAE